MPQKARKRVMERRRTPRADARLSMRVEGPRDEEAHARLVTESQNISASGVYCMSDHFLAPLSKVNLTIVLPRFGIRKGPNELIKCEGIVVRCDPQGSSKADKRYELACMFSGLDSRRRSLLDDFVTWRNLEALRAAARAANGPKRPVRRTGTARAATRTRTSTRRAATARPARAKSATRRRTVH
jgi:hypothetical protein